MTRYTRDGSNFGADGPFFRIIRQGLDGLADGEDYFDLLAEDVVSASTAIPPRRSPSSSYEVHGQSAQTGRPYDNRFVSIVTTSDGKVTRWRDHLDPVAVFDATGWPGVAD